MIVEPTSGNVIENSIYYLGEFEVGTIYVLKNMLKDGGILLDVGANIGFISCVIAKTLFKRGGVYAVEPHPNTLKLLEQNIALNNLKNIKILKTALEVINTDAIIYDSSSGDRGSASLIPPTINNHDSSGKKVKVTSIDKLILEKK